MTSIRRTALCGAVALALVSSAPSASPAAAPRGPLEIVVTKLGQPVYLTATASEPNRLYVVQRKGLVRVLVKGRLRSRPFLDLRRVVSVEGERGLLSLAFSPTYGPDGLLYVYYTDRQGAINIVEFHARRGVVDAGSARTVLRVAHEDSPYHNGGQLAFGPDGMLYAGLGDGGYAPAPDFPNAQPDPHGNSQNLDVLLGKIVRLDVKQAVPGAEIVAYGVRNPWRFSFNSAGDLVIADVGWSAAEEVDVLRAGSSNLVNFGWSVYEGTTPRRRGPEVQLNPAGELTGPAYAYSHDHANCSITGGYVYHGHGRVQRLRGRYVFGDYCSGRIWSLRLADGRASALRHEQATIKGLVSFGEDASGNLYAIAFGGTIYRFAR
jgi:glucose/arabinose dehydrogenase